MFTHAFAYGSLLNPSSLAATLPDVDLRSVEPAWLAGFARTFGVAFPNAGSQDDKAYLDAEGGRPPFVLFANLVARASEASRVNGVLVPVGAGDLERLRRRELRYDLIEASGVARPPAAPAGPGPVRVGVFVGKPAFTRPQDLARGVVAAAYRRRIEEGVAFWEARCPGFRRGYTDSTELSAALRTVELRRVDAAARGAGG